MANTRSFAFALLGLLTLTAVAPVCAQTSATPAGRQARRERRAERRQERRMDNTTMASGGTMAPLPGNNTAAVQANIDRANQTLTDMVALLDQIEARKRAATSGSPQ